MKLKRSSILAKYAFIQWLFPKLQTYAPFLANWWAPRLFFTPPHFPAPEKEKEWRSKAQGTRLDYKGRHVQVYTWGDTGPPVLMVHGWAGRGTNFFAFIPKLLDAGYRAVAFDAPAHGISSGKKTDLLEFMDIANILSEQYGPWAATIGHSLGGITGYLLVNQGMQTSSLITIGTPSRQENIFENFFIRRLKGDMSTSEHLEEWVKETMGFDFGEAFPLHERPLKNPESLLIVHDVADREVQVEEAEMLRNGNPGSKILITTGLGHARILKDPAVIEQCLDFIRNS